NLVTRAHAIACRFGPTGEPVQASSEAQPFQQTEFRRNRRHFSGVRPAIAVLTSCRFRSPPTPKVLSFGRLHKDSPGGQMKRRDFIAFLGAGAAAWPFAVRSQQPERMRHIGVLMGTAADDPQSQARTAAFAQGLAQLGWI